MRLNHSNFKLNQSKVYIFLPFIKLFLLIALIIIILATVDIKQVTNNFIYLSQGTIYISIILFASSIVMGALRWGIVLESLSIRLNWLTICKLYYSGLFVNTVIPGSIAGEIMKILNLKKHGVGNSRSLNSVLLDRICGILGTIILLLTSLLYLFTHKSDTDVLFVGSVFALTLISILAIIIIIDFLPRPFKNSKWIGLLFQLSKDTNALFKKIKIVSLVTILSMLAGIAHSYIIFLITSDLSELPINFYACLCFIPLITIISALPLSYAGWGIREVSLVSCYSIIGISSDIALTTSISFGILSYLVSFGGIIFIFDLLKNIRIRQGKTLITG